MKKTWRESAVNSVVPKKYPNGTEIPPEVRREIYAYYLLEKKLSKLKRLERVKKVGRVIHPRKRKKLKRVV